MTTDQRLSHSPGPCCQDTDCACCHDSSCTCSGQETCQCSTAGTCSCGQEGGRDTDDNCTPAGPGTATSPVPPRAAGAAHRPGPLEITFTPETPATIVVRNEGGDVHVQLRDDVTVVSCTVDGGPDVDLSGVTASCDGHRVDIRVPQPPRGLDPEELGGLSALLRRLKRIATFRGVDLLVVAPTGAALDVSTGGGDILLSGGFPGATKLETGGGDVAIVPDGPTERGLEGLKASTGGGDVRLPGIVNAKVTTGGGDIGALWCRNASLETGGGDIAVGEALDDVRLSSGGGDIRVDIASVGTLAVQTGGGDIFVGVRAGVPVWQQVKASCGETHLDIEPVGAPADGEPFLTLRLASACGDIHATTVR